MSRYLNPYTDFGFKKLFGEEANKDLLADFLNQLLPPHHQIETLHFKNPENLPDLPLERKAIFDVYCKSVTGEDFIVEIAKKGDWDFKLNAIYYVAILDFKYDEKEEKQKLLREVTLKDQDGDLFYKKLCFSFIQMPLFNKQEHELATRSDKWLYFLKNLENFDHIPAILKEPIFEKAFDTLEEANLTREQLEQYQKSLLTYWELKGVVDTARDEGKAEGKAEGLIEGIEKGICLTAQKLKQEGLSVEMIAKVTGLTVAEIENL